MKHPPRLSLPFATALLTLLLPTTTPAAPFDLATSTYLGSAADTDSVRGLRIQSNGVIVLAANVGATTPGNVTLRLLNGATATSGGTIIRLTPDGQRILSVTRVAAELTDLAIDEADNIVAAAGTGGVLFLDPDATIIEWSALAGTLIHRVDAAWDGHVVAHRPSNTADPDSAAGTGTTTVLGPFGDPIAAFSGYRNTTDVCIDGTSQTIVQIGWRQTNAFDGNRSQPVQIAYLRGLAYDGTPKWLAYDWSSTTASPDFLNRYTNNMADTRGYRCSMGRDGLLYAAFECAGGNHIFRWSAQDLAVPATVVGGDRWQQFSNTASEHKTFVARFEAATGAYQRGQQFVARLSNGKGNAIRTRRGEVRADELGRVYVGGAAASGLPIPFSPFYSPVAGQVATNPFGDGSYTGGAWFMVMSPDLRTRLYTTRLSTGGETNAIDARLLGGSPRVAWAGTTPAPVHTVAPAQPTSAGATEGFVAVLADGLEHDSLAAYRAARFSATDLADPAKETTVWGNQADADGDGANTLTEYFSGTDPWQPNPTPEAKPSLPASVVFQYRKAKAAPSRTGRVTSSTNLTTWSQSSIRTRATADLGDQYQMEATAPAITTDRLFLRLNLAPSP